MTATPVSNPESPSASLGKTSKAKPTASSGFPCDVEIACHQLSTATGCVNTSKTETASTTMFRLRYTATIRTATPMASLKPRRKTAPSIASRNSVTSTFCPCSQPGATGFWIRCAVASAADSVMVIMKSVAAKPSRTRTNSFPPHRGMSRSSIAMEPSPRWLSPATRR